MDGLSLSTTVTGDTNVNTLRFVNVQSGVTNLDLSGFTFVDWTDGVDVVRIEGGTSGLTTFTGSSVDDIIYGYTAPGMTLIGNAGDDRFRISWDDVAGTTFHGSASDGTGGSGETDVIDLVSSSSNYDFRTTTFTNIDAFEIRQSGGFGINGTTGEITSRSRVETFNASQFAAGLLAPDLIWQRSSDLTSGTYSPAVEVIIDTLGGAFDASGWTAGTGVDLTFAQLHVTGTTGDDTITGWAGRDMIVLNGGADTVSTGAGNDIVYLDETVTGGSVDGGDGTSDRVVMDLQDATTDQTVTMLDASETSSGPGGLSLTGFEELVYYGGSAVDTVIADGLQYAQVYGRNGNDSLAGRTTDANNGTLYFYGENGDDDLSLTADSHRIYFYGGNDNDTFTVGFNVTDDAYLEGNVGDHTFVVSGDVGYLYMQAEDGANTATVTGNTEYVQVYFRSFESNDPNAPNNATDPFADTVTISGDVANDVEFETYAGDDTITVSGDVGDDVYIYGGDGNDTITVSGNVGDDIYITSDDGDDEITITGDVGEDVQVLTGQGSDTLTWTAAGPASSFYLDGGSEDDGGGGVPVQLAENTAAEIDRLTLNLAVFTAAIALDLNSTGSGGSAFNVVNFEQIDITSGSGNDDISGGDLDDRILGGAGRDVLSGRGGDDHIEGGDGLDTIDGGAGNDTIDGGASIDVIDGGADDDTINGGAGSDTIDGGSGNDIIVGGTGADNLSGGIGDDTIYFDPFDLAVDGGDGIDTGDTRAFTGDVTLNMAALSLERLYTGVGDDVITTSGSVGVFMDTGAGDDMLTGASGQDDLNGGAGNDILNGMAGIDRAAGGTGNDTIYVDTFLDEVVELVGEGTFDQVLASASYALTAGAEVERLATSDISGTGAMTLIGNNFGQQLLGNNGDNILAGGGGFDTFVGYQGNDIYVLDQFAEAITEVAGEGYDSVYTSATYALAAGVSIERMVTTSQAGTTQIDLTGNEIGQLIGGNAANNTLRGGAGNDSIYGYNGNDLIDGGEGNDGLFGGAGVDRFLFSQDLGLASGIDRIYDMNSADNIVIDAIAETGLRSIAANEFVIGTAATDAAHRIIYDDTSGAFWFDADGNGAGAQIIFGVINGAPSGVDHTWFELW